MTRTLPTFPKRWVAFPGLLAAAAVAASLAPTSAATAPGPRFAIVADAATTTAAQAQAQVEDRERATGTDGAYRIARTPTEALNVTHLLAAQGYDTVITDGIDARVAVEPVAERYPATRFVNGR